tara:strand:- start:175 stop:1503 length:1329 start_codon:yes stop_codon:yes gene_type:complete
MKPEEEKQIIKQAGLEDEIFRLKNVQSFYPGTKIKNGVDTGEPCMIIGVTKKEKLENIKPSDLIPSVLNNNIKTDIVEEEEVLRYGSCGASNVLGEGVAPSGACSGHDYNSDSSPFSNSQGGVSIGPNDPRRSWSGTLGLIAKDKTDSKLVALSNNHVLGDYVDTNYSSLGCYLDNGELSDYFKVDSSLRPVVENIIRSPSVSDSIGSNFVNLGKVKRSIPTKWGKVELPINTVDAGIVELGSNIQPMTNLAHFSSEALQVSHARVGARVFKSGRTTGVTGVSEDISNPTRIVSTNYTVAISSGCGDGLKTKFTDCIKFNWNSSLESNWEFFSYAGDSGSAIMMEDGGEKKLVGLLFAGTYFSSSAHVPNPPYGTGIACKIQNVFDSLNLEPWNGNVVCDSDSPFVRVNGRCYENTLIKKEKSLVSHTESLSFSDIDSCENI